MAGKAFENPLIPNARMREMYAVMLESRILGRQMRRQHTGFAPGLEAMWVATAIDLREGDLTCDSGIGPVLGYARDGKRSEKKALKTVLAGEPGSGRLALAGSGLTRMWCGVGAALALRAAGQAGVAVVYAGQGELKPKEWAAVLSCAADAPVIFVVLPEPGEPLGVAELASRAGVPGIPVDASDAVAIYRVAQESIGRARADGKAALIAGVPFFDKKGKKIVDPVEFLGQQLLAKRVATASWMAGVETRFRRRLNAALPDANGLH
jgi:hypothetical protein